jgi:hypothetical protein
MPCRCHGATPDGFGVKRQVRRVLWAVVPAKAEQTNAPLREPWMVRFIEEGLVPKTVEVTEPLPPTESTTPSLRLEHEALEFPCFPHEIVALQLYDSACLTLQIAIEAAQQG